LDKVTLLLVAHVQPVRGQVAVAGRFRVAAVVVLGAAAIECPRGRLVVPILAVVQAARLGQVALLGGVLSRVGALILVRFIRLRMNRGRGVARQVVGSELGIPCHVLADGIVGRTVLVGCQGLILLGAVVLV